MRARILRALGFMAHLKGWRRIAGQLTEREGPFVIRNGDLWYAGDLASFIDREVYLYRGYDKEQISAFLAACNPNGTILDIGANSGTHSLCFARKFDQVIAFEPNPDLWAPFKRNLKLNGMANVTLEEMGLAEFDGRLNLHRANSGNPGIGTFLPEFENESAEIVAKELEVRALDGFLPNLSVAAVKIDVEGYEPIVLRGMQQTLARCRPVVWLEVGHQTVLSLRTRRDLERHFPYPVTIKRFQASRRGWLRTCELISHDSSDLPASDYLVVPADTKRAC